MMEDFVESIGGMSRPHRKVWKNILLFINRGKYEAALEEYNDGLRIHRDERIYIEPLSVLETKRNQAQHVKRYVSELLPYVEDD